MSQFTIVLSIMITYNHEKYIQQAIKGVLIQAYNFTLENFILRNNNYLIKFFNQFNYQKKYFYDF